MTPELTERLSRGRAPFDGWTMQSETMDLAHLRTALIKTAESLRSHEGVAELFWFKDWFFHDECPSLPIAFDWSEFDRKVMADENVRQFCVGDDLCTFAIFPANFAWLFQIDVPEDQEAPGVWQGGFNVTGRLDLVRSLAESLASLHFTFDPATKFYVPYWERWTPEN